MNNLETLKQADAHYNNCAWNEALDAYSAVVTQNPYHGKYWYRLGEIHHHLKNHDDAIHAFNQSIKLGYDIPESMYYLARIYALQNQAQEAVKWLKQVIYTYHGSRYIKGLETEKDFESIRSREDFCHLLPPKLPDDISRTQGWQADLDYMVSYMEQTHFDLFRIIDPEEWKIAVESLAQKIAQLADHEIIVELMKIVARVGDGHTIVLPPYSGRFLFHKVPVIFNEFSDGLFVEATTPKYKDAVGTRVLKIGQVSTEQALYRLESVIPRDNPMTIKWLRPVYLSSPEILHALKISDHIDQVEIEIKNDSGAQSKVTLPLAEPMGKIVDHFRNRTAQEGWITVRDQADTPPPLWLKNPNNPYWFEYLPKEQVVYFQYNVVANKQDESIKDFSSRLFQFINTHDVSALIIDIRMNDGGNGSLNQAIIHDIIRCAKINQNGKLFTIIGRGTFSAGQMFATDLELHTKTLFVGEPTGSSPNHVGEGNYITLPYSNLSVNASPLYWQSSKAYDLRIWIPPDIIAEQTSKDYKSNTDPAVNAILRYITKKD